MSEDQLTLLTLDLRPIPDHLRSGAIFVHVQRSPPTFPTMPLRWRSLPINLRSLPFNSRLFPIGPDFQIGLDREQIVAQWNGGITDRESTVPATSCSPVSPFLRFVVTEPSGMKSVRTTLSTQNFNLESVHTEGCHVAVGLFREFVGSACCTKGPFTQGCDLRATLVRPLYKNG